MMVSIYELTCTSLLSFSLGGLPTFLENRCDPRRFHVETLVSISLGSRRFISKTRLSQYAAMPGSA